MTDRELAVTLYEMSVDIDHEDYADRFDEEVEELEMELANVTGTLRNCLEIIAEFY